ncbi:MAG: carboxylesterase family protein, partial [Porticoccaceae bacterium]
MKPLLFIALTLALVSCKHSDSQDSAVQDSAYKVATTSGVTQGRANSSQKGASAKESAALDVVGWFDIPYAQPPLGDLRWRAPRPLLTPEAAIAEKESTACV